jgi:hypothetical protein
MLHVLCIEYLRIMQKSVAQNVHYYVYVRNTYYTRKQ